MTMVVHLYSYILLIVLLYNIYIYIFLWGNSNNGGLLNARGGYVGSCLANELGFVYIHVCRERGSEREEGENKSDRPTKRLTDGETRNPSKRLFCVLNRQTKQI